MDYMELLRQRMESIVLEAAKAIASSTQAATQAVLEIVEEIKG